jgi:hypothetical protein
MNQKFNTSKPSPYERVPLASLLYVRNASTNDSTSQRYRDNDLQVSTFVEQTTIAPTKPAVTINKELDLESGFRLIEYIDAIGGTIDVNREEMERFKQNKQNKQNKQDKQDKQNRQNDGGAKQQHRPSFYIPAPQTSTTTAGTKKVSLIDRLSSGLSNAVTLKTEHNVRRLSKDILLYNGLTIESVVRHCRVAISNLRGNLLPAFQDLVDMSFKPQDMLIDRTLFNCNTLKNLYDANYATIVAHGVPFDLTHLMMDNGFTSSELIALGFPLGKMIDEDGIRQGQLRAIRFPLSDLVQLGFCKAHLTKLAISREIALKPIVPNGTGGFGWSHDEYELLLASGGELC